MSKADQQKYKEIFLAEALDQQSQLDELLTQLEKAPGDAGLIEEIFRITHTLKGNAKGMGFDAIATLGHTLEDIFGAAKENKLPFSQKLFEDLFKANDTLVGLIKQINYPELHVPWRGVQTKLKVFLRTATSSQSAAPSPAPKEINESEGTEPWAETYDNGSKISFSESIKVPIEKLDHLMKLVGELIIERDRITAFAEDRNSPIKGELSMLHRITSELQYSIMDARMIKADFLFNKFHRIVRDAAAVDKKKVKLTLSGTHEEIDRNILQAISDSLIHLVRNAISHGIESPEDREALGKPREGQVTLLARNEQDIVTIEVQDDGKGIDPDKIRKKAIAKGLILPALVEQMNDSEVIQLIFQPGFSSLDQVNELSGRGVGMDVVSRAINSIGGKVRVETEVGKGTQVILSLPTTMAVKGALLFEIRNSAIAIPLSYTESVVKYTRQEIHKVGMGLMAEYLGKTIPLVFLHDVWQAPMENGIPWLPHHHHSLATVGPGEELPTIIVSHEGKEIGLIVDRLLQQKEIVEKKLENPLDALPLFTGATILGNGAVCLVLDVPAIVDLLFMHRKNTRIRQLENSNALP